MLTIPTADEIVRMTDGKDIFKNSESWSDQRVESFSRSMRESQKRLLLERHYFHMTTEERVRTDMIIKGTYHGKTLPSGSHA